MSQVLTDNADYITANQNTVYALDGDDRIFTTAAGPDIYGGNGHDFIGNQGSGIMYAFGGIGSDTLHGGSNYDALYGEIGDDLLVGGEYEYTFGASIQIKAGESSGEDYLDGGSGRDSIYGLDGNDVILGGEGDDSTVWTISPKNHEANNHSITLKGGLYGGTGDDYIDGGRGDDALFGGDGDDVMIGGTGDDYFDGGDGDDLILTSAPTTASDGHNTVFGGDGADTIRAYGYDDVYGGYGADTIVADGAYSVTLRGEGDNDLLFGSQSADILNGGAGGDALSGGFGNDIYVGGLGVDHFVMNRDIQAGDIDIIADFAGDFISMPTEFFGYVGAMDTASGVFLYVPMGSSVWGVLVTNTHDVAAVYGSVYYS